MQADMPRASIKPDYAGFEIGRTVAFGHKVVTKEEIIAFARAFDPQPFHLSEEGAKDSNIGRLIASGYHTCAMLMRLLVDHVIDVEISLGSPGLDEVRFLKPVFPGDTLSGRYTCLSKRVSASRPGVGIVQFKFELVNGAGDLLMTWENAVFLRTGRTTDPAGGSTERAA